MNAFLSMLLRIVHWIFAHIGPYALNIRKDSSER